MLTNDVWGMGAVIAYWWRVTTGNRVMILIGWRRGTKPTEIWDWFIFCFLYRFRRVDFHKIIRDRVINRFLKLWIPRAYDSATVLTIPMFDFHAVKSAPPPPPCQSTPAVPKTSPNPLSSTVTNTNFLLTISIHCQEIMITKEKMPRSFIKFSQLNL